MGITIGLGSLVMLYALFVLFRSCHLKQKVFYVTVSSLILLGTLLGICAVIFWRMFAESVTDLPIVNEAVFQ